MKQLIIMRGLPGSGKSTAAADIVGKSIVLGVIRSTDTQFIVNGEYKFDPTLLHFKHAANQRLVKDDMLDGVPLIIVDNTNIKRSDFAVYIQMAKEFGYEVLEYIMQEPPFTDEYIRMCYKRNKHGVPFEAIQRMAKKFEK